ncbi:MAG: hypothetical protein C0609_06740 [Deltaproteobacteria bacterium]|nr:MAG: hypothetical protein C0609_06740 [Deltaproteobacteria bacterium]
MKKLSRNPDLVWRDEPAEREGIVKALEGGDESAAERGWVIIIDKGSMHQLNLLAGEIWLLLDGTLDEYEVAKNLASRYDAPIEEIIEDVREFIADCEKKGWLA